MKILYATRHIDRPETALLDLLRRSGMEVTVICHPDTKNLGLLQDAGIEPLLFGFENRVQVSAVSMLRKLLRQRRFDLIHAVASKALANSLFATLGSRVPVVGYRGTVGHLSRWDPGSWIAHRHPRVRKIVCVSEAVRAYLISQGFREDRLVTIHKGHEAAWYEWTGTSIRAELGLRDGEVLVGCAANDRPHKGVSFLIDAMHRLSDDRVHLVCAGTMGASTVQRAKNGPASSRIHLVGYRSDATKITGGCDLFVMPSTEREGFARAVLEAMAQGVPAIVTNVGGLPEMVVDRVQGRVVPPSDALSLALAIEEMSRSPELRRRYGAAAKQRVENEFSPEQTFRKTEALYKSLTATS